MISETIWSQKGKEKKEFSNVLFVKYLQAVYLWSTSFQRMRSRYSSKIIKIFFFVLIWSTQNNLLTHIKIICYIILDKNCSSFSKATVRVQEDWGSMSLFLRHMPLLSFLWPSSPLILSPFLFFSLSHAVIYF